MPELTYLQAISDGLRTEMRRDKRVFVIGEDVGVYGGAFKGTLGFQEEFRHRRVIDARRAGTAIPITVRLPSGGGFSGGPFHSQNPESSFAHVPGLKCLCPATPEDAKGLLISAIEDPNPCLFFEHKHLYRRIKAEVPEQRYTVPIGKARTHQEGTDVTVVTWGAMVYTAEEAAKELESDLSVEIV